MMGEKSEHTSRMLIKGVKKHSTREEKRPVCVCVCVLGWWWWDLLGRRIRAGLIGKET